MSEIAYLLILAALLTGWWVHTRVTYRWRAAHRRETTPPRHRLTLSTAPVERRSHRRLQEDPNVDPAVLRALEGLERPL